MRPLPGDYAERVYAGVLGKIIGVYLGRPIEGMYHDEIVARFGEVDRYLHEERGVPLVVPDDDISGTFTFLRALEDHAFDPDLTPSQIGDTWLNYIIEKKTVLWWGGVGVSTEHTAFQRLKDGMRAPESGSISLNGKVVAEQIGAQIFIDGWGLVNPGDPERAADFARRAASVSHDGEAIYGAQVIAALVAGAFEESSVGKLLDVAVALIPSESVIASLIRDVREWHAAGLDWRAGFRRIEERYGYECYGGGCHIVPNHALVIHALLHGDGDFDRSLAIVNTCGWDTDCNSGNVGCILGVLNGLEGIGDKWRRPVADRMYLPTADGGRCFTDAVREAWRVVDAGRALRGERPVARPRFGFEFPGSVQGFSRDASLENPRGGGITFAGPEPLRLDFETFEEELAWGYGLVSSPSLFPGQTVTISATADAGNGETVEMSPRLVWRREPSSFRIWSPEQRLRLAPGEFGQLSFKAPVVPSPLLNLQVELKGPGRVTLHSVDWSGVPEFSLEGEGLDPKWWTEACDDLTAFEDRLRLVQNSGKGMALLGCRDWEGYSVTATVSARLANAFGIACGVQGLRRYMALILSRDGFARLIRVVGQETVLAEAPFAWSFDEQYELSLALVDGRVEARIAGGPELSGDAGILHNGGVALIAETGNVSLTKISLGPTAEDR